MNEEAVRALIREEIVKAFRVMWGTARDEYVPYGTSEIEGRILAVLGTVSKGAADRVETQASMCSVCFRALVWDAEWVSVPDGKGGRVHDTCVKS